MSQNIRLCAISSRIDDAIEGRLTFWEGVRKERDSLRAKLDIAVKALGGIGHKSRASECRYIAWDALAQIQVGVEVKK